MNRPTTTILVAGIAMLSACTAAKEAANKDTVTTVQAGGPFRAGYDASTHTATLVAKDYAFDAPDTIGAGWVTIRMKNDGTVPHHATLVRLDSGKTYSDLETLIRKPARIPGWVVALGGPNAPDLGAESNATMHLEPGQYALICFVDVPGNTPHFMKGMVRPLVVAPPAAGVAAVEPAHDVTVLLTDYAFTIEGTLNGGKHTLRVLNQGPQDHELELMRFAPGKTVQDFGAWLAKMDGPPPAKLLGGLASEAKSVAGYFTVDLAPGHYALLCFVPDAKDGKMHLEHGMIKEFTVE